MSPYIIPGLVRSCTDLSPDEVIREVAAFHHMEPQDLFKKTRERKFVKARWEVVWILRRKMKMTLKEISKVMHQHHSTLIHSLTMMDAELKTYVDYRESINELLKVLTKTGSLRYKKYLKTAEA